jgi:hypothetical protein
LTSGGGVFAAAVSTVRTARRPALSREAYYTSPYP